MQTSARGSAAYNLACMQPGSALWLGAQNLMDEKYVRNATLERRVTLGNNEGGAPGGVPLLDSATMCLVNGCQGP